MPSGALGICLASAAAPSAHARDYTIPGAEECRFPARDLLDAPISDGVLAAALLWSAIVPCALSQFGGPGRPDRDGHERMLAELKRVKERSATENVYTGDDLLADERAQLEALPPEADPAVGARLNLQVGRDDLRMGRNRLAVDRLETAYSLAGNDSVEEGPSRLRWPICAAPSPRTALPTAIPAVASCR